jgi:hypothetical protein
MTELRSFANGYTVEYNKQEKIAKLKSINKEDKNYKIGPGFTNIQVKWNKTTLNLQEYEFEDDLCFDGIYNVLKTASDEAKKEEEYPWIGRVFLSTVNASSTSKCIIGAFEKVGFVVNKSENKNLKKLISKKREEEDNPLIQKLMKRFYSESQAKLYNKKYGEKKAAKLNISKNVNPHLKF